MNQVQRNFSDSPTNLTCSLTLAKLFWNMPLHFDTFHSLDLVCSEVTECGQVLNIALDLQNKFWSSAHIS